MKDSKILQASTKNRTKSISPWKKKNSPVEPRQKNKISNFGTFFLYTQILFTTLSLSIWKRIKARKRHLYSWTILLYIFDTLNVYIYIYITVVKNLCIFILPCGLCYYFMLPFSFYSPYVILLRTVLLIPKVSHGKPELPTTTILILLQLSPIGPYSSII